MVNLFYFAGTPRDSSKDFQKEISSSDRDSLSRTEASERALRVRNANSTRTLPLSMQLMKSVAGIGCIECEKKNASSRDEDHEATQALLADYDLQALRRQKSAVSPLVLAPMMMPSNNDSEAHSIVERIIGEYIAACKFYGTGDRINSGILTALRFSLPSLRVGGSFHDADMLALAEILFRYANGPLRYIKRLDFSLGSKEGKLHGRAGFQSHGALTLSKVLQMSEHIEEVYLQRNRIGSYGASALFIACSNNPTVKKLLLRRCNVGERGAFAFAELIATSSETGLEEVDLSVNNIGFRGCVAVQRALADRAAKSDLTPLMTDLEGNLVFQEIMNGVTHGLGILIAIIGTILLSRRVKNMSHRHVLSCAVYSTSLIALYMSSTLFHSFFSLKGTKYIFEVCDKCAIYILIAGSYTPFLQVVLAHEPLYSIYLLAFIWCCCCLGIGVEAFFPTWQHKGRFSLAMYLGMGWSALVCLPEVTSILPEGCIHLMVLGGVGYTAGVPFFLRNNNLDHAVWHLFVLAGSIFHWCGIYFYVAPYVNPVG